MPRGFFLLLNYVYPTFLWQGQSQIHVHVTVRIINSRTVL